MTLVAPSQFFAPYVLGASLKSSFSFSPFTFFRKAGPGQQFIAKFEQNHSSHAATEISTTCVEAVANADLPFFDQRTLGAPSEFNQDYFLLRSCGNSQATVSASLELLQAFFVFCKNPEGCMVTIWMRDESEVFSSELHVGQGLTMLNMVAMNLVLDNASITASLKANVFVSVELPSAPSLPLSDLVYVKPIRLCDASQAQVAMNTFASIPFGDRYSDCQDIVQFDLEPCQVHRVQSLSRQSSEQRCNMVSYYFDQLLGNKKTPNPVHLASMLTTTIDGLGTLPLMASRRVSCQADKNSDKANRETNTNYMVIMTPRSGSTALSEKLATLGIGCPTELTTSFFYNLFSHLEASAETQSYINFVLDLLRDPVSSISGIQIDPDRLSHTWQSSLVDVIDKYIYFFRSSISKQALSMSLAVHHNIWFSYDPSRYNTALEKLTISEFKDQLIRISRMNVLCLEHYLENRQNSIILTNEQHLRSFQSYIPLITSHLGCALRADDQPGSELVSGIASSSKQPTQEIEGRDKKAGSDKLARFLDELGVASVADTLAYVDSCSQEVADLYFDVFTV